MRGHIRTIANLIPMTARLVKPCALNPSVDLSALEVKEENRLWTLTWIEEYRTLREESAQSRVAQQQILQWSMAGLSAIIAGGLVFLNGYAADKTPEHLLITLMIFGLLIPVVAICSNLSWWAEVFRMERAGTHIRGMEGYAHRNYVSPFDDTEPSMVFETSIAFGRTRKIAQGYTGALGLYTSLTTGSEVVCIILLADFGHSIAWNHGVWTAVNIFPCAVIVIYAVASVMFIVRFRRNARRIRSQSDSVYAVSQAQASAAAPTRHKLKSGIND